MTATYESVQAGDELPVVVKWETAESIARFLGQTGMAEVDEDTADGDTADAIIPPEMVAGYVRETLEKGLPIPPEPADALRLAWQSQRPIPAGDTVSISGKVTGKAERDGRRWVECQVVVENQEGQVVFFCFVNQYLRQDSQ